MPLKMIAQFIPAWKGGGNNGISYVVASDFPDAGACLAADCYTKSGGTGMMLQTFHLRPWQG